MEDDDKLIVDWLRGREKLPQRGYPSPGLWALIRRLEKGEPLGERVSIELAKALEPIGLSPMKLTLSLKHRSRGRPRNDVRQTYQKLKLGAAIEAKTAEQEAPGGRKQKRDLVTKDVAKEAGKSRASGYAALKTLRRAKGLEK